MILEKETYEKFGYYPSGLGYGSHKRIIVQCDTCGKRRIIQNQGYRRTIQKYGYQPNCRACANGNKNSSIKFREKISKVLKGRFVGEKNSMFGRRGKNHPAYGRRLSEKAKEKISEANKGNTYCLGRHLSEETKQKMSEKAKERFTSEKEREKLREARRHRKFPKHHTKPELIFEELCEKHSLPFRYTGDGALWIGKKGKRQFNPDFIECNGKKIVIEIFGDYWHSPLLNRNIQNYMTLEYRKRHYKQYGWKSIFLWETDLKRPEAEQFILDTLEKEGIKFK